MNKINVLYQNLNFQGGKYKNLEAAPFFASDVTLSDLLQKANVSKYENVKKTKKTSCTKFGAFEKHPREISDNSLVSVDEFPFDDAAKKIEIENIMRKVTFMKQRRMKLEGSDDDLTEANPSCKIISRNVSKIEIDITDEIIEEKEREKDKPVMNKPQPPVPQHVQEEILGVKLKGYLVKICAWMNEIRSSLQLGIAPIEDEDDYYKRERRAQEFGSRFSRNYLYQLNRQLMELRRTLTRANINSARPGAPSTARCLTNASQTVLQAVQAYCNHIPSTVHMPNENSLHGKFTEVLKHIEDLCRIIRKLSCTYYDVSTCLSVVEDIEANCQSLTKSVHKTLIKRPEPPQPKSPVIKKPQLKKGPKGANKRTDIPFQKRNTIENRLSMYSVSFVKDKKATQNFKKSSELSRQRLHSAQTKRNNNLSKTIQSKLPATDRNPEPRKILLGQSSPSNSHISIEPVIINEDEIETMVQVDQQMQVQVQNAGIRNRIEPLLKTLVAEVSAGKKEELLGQGVCEDMLGKLRDLLDQLQQPKPLAITNQVDSCDSIPSNYIKVTGPRNAKLICIKDKSLFESKTETETETTKPKKETKPINKSFSNLPTLERKKSRKLKESNSQVIANLPKQYTINIIQYKIDFHKYTKPMMMYKKNSSVLPWILTSKITDSLFDHLLISVINETNIDGLVQKIYEQEFETVC